MRALRCIVAHSPRKRSMLLAPQQGCATLDKIAFQNSSTLTLQAGALNSRISSKKSSTLSRTKRYRWCSSRGRMSGGPTSQEPRSLTRPLDSFPSDSVPSGDQAYMINPRSLHYVNRTRHLCERDIFRTLDKCHLIGALLENFRE